MNIVIIGSSRAGAHLARMMAADGHKVTVIDRNRQSFDRLGDDFPGKTVVGTGIDEDVLRRAGIEHADALIALTNGDNTNVMAAQIAKEIFGVQRVICRIYDPLRAEFYHSLGIETICPTIWSATQISSILQGQDS